jgi:hypothetical protein
LWEESGRALTGYKSMRWSAWPRPNDPKSTPSTWRQGKKKGLCDGIMLDYRPLIQIDLEKELAARKVEAPEIVLAMWVVVAVEGVERYDFSDRHRAHVARQSVDARRQHRAGECRIEGLAKRVVEIANAFASRFVSERHVLLHAIDAPLWRAERRRGTLSIIILGVVAVRGGGSQPSPFMVIDGTVDACHNGGVARVSAASYPRGQ